SGLAGSEPVLLQPLAQHFDLDLEFVRPLLEEGAAASGETRLHVGEQGLVLLARRAGAGLGPQVGELARRVAQTDEIDRQEPPGAAEVAWVALDGAEHLPRLFAQPLEPGFEPTVADAPCGGESIGHDCFGFLDRANGPLGGGAFGPREPLGSHRVRAEGDKACAAAEKAEDECARKILVKAEGGDGENRKGGEGGTEELARQGRGTGNGARVEFDLRTQPFVDEPGGENETEEGAEFDHGLDRAAAKRGGKAREKEWNGKEIE